MLTLAFLTSMCPVLLYQCVKWETVKMQSLHESCNSPAANLFVSFLQWFCLTMHPLKGVTLQLGLSKHWDAAVKVELEFECELLKGRASCWRTWPMASSQVPKYPKALHQRSSSWWKSSDIQWEYDGRTMRSQILICIIWIFRLRVISARNADAIYVSQYMHMYRIEYWKSYTICVADFRIWILVHYLKHEPGVIRPPQWHRIWIQVLFRKPMAQPWKE